MKEALQKQIQEKVRMQSLGTDFSSDPFKKEDYGTSGSILKQLRSPKSGTVGVPDSERNLESD